MTYIELIRICSEISSKLDVLTLSIQHILYLITFFFILKVGFTCLRGYKV